MSLTPDDSEAQRERLVLAIADGLPIDWSAEARGAALGTAELEALRSLEALRTSTPPQSGGLAPGTLLGDFRLKSLLGQGGMGQVWEAEQLSLGRSVAVKFVRPERVTELQIEFFAREARAGGRLSHPGLVAVHGHGRTGEQSWIAMELVPGGRTLRTLLDERRRSVPEQHDRDVAELVARIADAMQAAHDAGVIHRDLKPENVLLDPHGQPRVTDFGLARIEGEQALSMSGIILGTCFYVSPEHAAGKRAEIDARTDIFSLGVVLFELLALRRPFEGDTTEQVLDKIRRLPPPDLRTLRSRVPRDLAIVCAKTLEKDPRRRYPSMAELAADLRRFLGNSPILARPASRTYRLTKWAQRNPALGSAEFVDLQTGRPLRRDSTGNLVLEESTGLVFVLLPGGPTWIGSQSTDTGGRHFFAMSPAEEGPVHEVVLAPFFLSKYEMTQGQWSRFTGANPSYSTTATWLNQQSRKGTWTLLQPVEQVSWFQCMRVLLRLGMDLPTEAQWEYGARAGTDTPWWCGSEARSIFGAGNLADLYAKEYGGSDWAAHEPWDDGYTGTAPIGIFAPNPFGLHDVIGNVWEWCRDTYQLSFYTQSPRFDPVSEEAANHANHVWRGGGANERSGESRSGHRAGLTPDAAAWMTGVRPARKLEASDATSGLRWP